MFVPLSAGLALAGCVAPTCVVTAPPAAPAARVAVLNLTPYAWRVTLVAAGGAARVVSVEPAATVEFELAGGDYRMEQALLSATETREPARSFSATFEAGQAYRWPLATLATGGDGRAVQSGGGER